MSSAGAALATATPRQKIIAGGILTVVGFALMWNTLTTCPTSVCRATVSGLTGAGMAAFGIVAMLINYYRMRSNVDSPASVRE